MTKREELAWLLYKRNARCADCWDIDTEEVHDAYRADVDALLEALMEPSEEMILAGQARPPEHIGWDIPTGESVIYRWQAMLRAIKDDHSE